MGCNMTCQSRIAVWRAVPILMPYTSGTRFHSFYSMCHSVVTKCLSFWLCMLRRASFSAKFVMIPANPRTTYPIQQVLRHSNKCAPRAIILLYPCKQAGREFRGSSAKNGVHKLRSLDRRAGETHVIDPPHRDNNELHTPLCATPSSHQMAYPTFGLTRGGQPTYYHLGNGYVTGIATLSRCCS